MATLQDIRRRIRSVRNTGKITKAMELVAAARLRRAEERIVQMRDYADRMQELTAGTARAASSLRGLTLLQEREPRRVAIVALTGDRGLAGAFNGQVLRRAFALERSLRSEGREVRWLVVGRKGRSTLRFRRYEVDQAWTGFTDRPAYHDAQAVAHRLAELYTQAEVDRALLESAASEHGARMTAMRNASKNAVELIDSLTLDLNRARQAEITQEILEVVAGADALTQ